MVIFYPGSLSSKIKIILSVCYTRYLSLMYYLTLIPGYSRNLCLLCNFGIVLDLGFCGVYGSIVKYSRLPRRLNHTLTSLILISSRVLKNHSQCSTTLWSQSLLNLSIECLTCSYSASIRLILHLRLIYNGLALINFPFDSFCLGFGIFDSMPMFLIKECVYSSLILLVLVLIIRRLINLTIISGSQLEKNFLQNQYLILHACLLEGSVFK